MRNAERLLGWLDLTGISRAELARRIERQLGRPVHRSHVTRILDGHPPTLAIAAAIEKLTASIPRDHGGPIMASAWVDDSGDEKPRTTRRAEARTGT